jgi:aminopeptidase
MQKIIETDEGARNIGEIALVPHNSPISQTGLIFYNILIDENASNHIALGQGYRDSLINGSEMTEEEFIAAGGNQSNIHLDVMIGSADMNVEGIMEDGTFEPIMRNGEWAFEV